MENENFYLNVKVWGDNILYKGIKNGKRVQLKVPYSPSIFVPTKEESDYKTIYGENLKEIKPGSIKKTKDYIKKFKEIENFKIFGNNRFEYCYISDMFPKEVIWEISKINIGLIDIEVESDPESGGFASPENPFQPIISIAFKLYKSETTYLFGYFDFDAPTNVIYIKCNDEYDLLKRFIEVWRFHDPDIISGWNTDGFDIPYLINRSNKIIGEEKTNRFSQWNIIQETNERTFNTKFNKFEEKPSFKIVGISSLDYMVLYKKYRPGGNSKASYKLDNICHEEINEKKVEYDGPLYKLYKEDKDKFYKYNIQDVLLIEKLDEKCRLFFLCLTLTYNSKTNPEDVFQQTRMWDSLIYDFLKNKNIQIPQNEISGSVEYEGAYVKPTIPGMYKWVVTLDATSLYPSIIMGKNISPETLVQPEEYNSELRNLISSGVNVENLLNKKLDLSCLKRNNVTLTPNGQFFRTDKKGFLPEMTETLFAKRVYYKKKMLEYQKEFEKLSLEKAPKEQLDKLDFEISRYDALQNAIKLCLNSLYGCLGTKYFRFFDVRQAEAITLEGQLSNRWVSNNINNYLNSLFKTNEDFVIGGDTDSLFVRLDKLVDMVGIDQNNKEKVIDFLVKAATNKIQPNIDIFCSELKDYVNSFDSKIKYKLEKICSTGIFLAKKRYVLSVFSNEGVVFAEPKIKVTGLEIVKSSSPDVVKKPLRHCIKLIMDDDKEEMQRYVLKFKEQFMNSTVEEISFPRGINDLGTYFDKSSIYTKGTPIHVRGALIYNHLLDKNGFKDFDQIRQGDKIKFCYLKVPNPIKENVISFPENLPKKFNLQNYIDYELMWEKVFIEPLKSITSVIDWDIEKRFSLEEFF